MSEIRTLGPVGLNPLGDYNSQTEYEKLDVVLYQGSSYVALKPVQGIVPTNAEYWQKLVSGGVSRDEVPLIFNTVAEMKSAEDLVIGDIAQTLGYYESNDGGAGEYKIVNDSSLVDDGSVIHELENGFKAVMILKNNVYNVKSLGIKSNDENANNAELLNNFISYLNNNNLKGTIFFPHDLYYFEAPISLIPELIIDGNFSFKYGNTQLTEGLYFMQTDGFINMNRNKIKNIMVYGNNESVGFRNANSGNGSFLDNLGIYNWHYGIFLNYKSSVITSSTINNNMYGIAYPTDTRIINNTISSNSLVGIQLGSGCNDNIITNNRIEWNNGNGILGESNQHNTIANNIFDRNSLYAIYLKQCSQSTVVSNMLRRNYASKTTQSSTFSHLRFDNCNNCNVSENMTRKYVQYDNGTGETVPSASIYISGCDSLNVIGNDLSGCVTTEYKELNSTNILRIDKGNFLQTNTSSVSVSRNGNTNTVQFKIKLPNDYEFPNHKRIIIRYRTISMSNGGALETLVTLFNQYNTTPVVNIKDTNINSDLQITNKSYDSSTELLTLTIKNNSTTEDYSIRMTIFDY